MSHLGHRRILLIIYVWRSPLMEEIKRSVNQPVIDERSKIGALDKFIEILSACVERDELK